MADATLLERARSDENGETPDDDDDDGSGITELMKIEPDRIDGVGTPASGFPVLMLKSIAPPGGGPMPESSTQPGVTAVEEVPQAGGPEDGTAPVQASDGDGGQETRVAGRDARAAYAKALSEHRGSEPSAKGALDATDYLQAQAAWRRWNDHGKAEGLDGTEAGRSQWITKHAAPETETAPAGGEPAASEEILKAEADVYKRDIDTATRRKLAAEHKALPDGSYPIENKEDLKNAATLARSGHGNAAGAKRLISRRAKELGVANPLDSDGDAKKDGGEKCPTCKGSGKIKGGNVTCPECHGKGTIGDSDDDDDDAKKSAAALAEPIAVDQAVALLGAMAEAGLVNAEDAQKLIDQASKAAQPGARPLPPEVQPAAPHREPDGTSTVEELEPEAGLPTDADATPDKVPASIGKAAPYEVRRMHDALCPAWNDQTVQEAYPALKSAAGAVMPGWFAGLATQKREAGKMRKAAELDALAVSALALAGLSPAAVADARAEMVKAAGEGYPNAKVSPQANVRPGSYHRPYITAGHAAANSGQWTVNAPPSSHVPEPQQFQRGNLTAGHAAPSPGDHGPNNPNPPGSSGREYYSTTEKDMARAAMASIHDHVAATFMGMCPMAPARSVLPPGMGATSGPEARPVPPMGMGGLSSVGKDAQDAAALAAVPAVAAPAPEPPAVPPAVTSVALTAPEPGLTAKDVRRITKRALAEALAAHQAGNTSVDPAQIEALVAAQVTPLRERYDAENAALKAQIEVLGSQPDPAMAPVRGQMTRSSAQPAPVEKRSLVEEARAARHAETERAEAQYRDYLRMQTESPDPKVRLRAEALLEKQS